MFFLIFSEFCTPRHVFSKIEGCGKKHVYLATGRLPDTFSENCNAILHKCCSAVFVKRSSAASVVRLSLPDCSITPTCGISSADGFTRRPRRRRSTGRGREAVRTHFFLAICVRRSRSSRYRCKAQSLRQSRLATSECMRANG